MNAVGWFQHEELTTDFQINPNNSCVAIAAAKNVNNEWGPVTELFFTTPAQAATRSESNVISSRKINNVGNKAGQLPSFKQKGQLRLISK